MTTKEARDLYESIRRGLISLGTPEGDIFPEDILFFMEKHERDALGVYVKKNEAYDAS
jgi:hypothetical protein